MIFSVPYLHLQHDRYRYEQSTCHHASTKIIIHVAIADMDETVGAFIDDQVATLIVQPMILVVIGIMSIRTQVKSIAIVLQRTGEQSL